MRKIKRSRRMQRGSRGSALLVSLMVIVGLSLLGLGFVAISETESAISKNQETATETQAIAEAGAKLVVEWFQNPSWGISTAAMPTNTGTTAAAYFPTAGAIKTQRVITGSEAYTGVYKPNASTMLFDKPYRPGNDDRFFGDEQHADVIIDASVGGQPSQALLDAFNNVLLASNGAVATASDRAAGEVTDIRVYAPPVVGGTLVNGFWTGAPQRYGVATIAVTAQQFRNLGDNVNHTSPTGVIASHTVRVVVGELPLPIPAGPIQGNANVAFGGNFRVHWGMETSTGNLTPSLNLSSLPWANAYERPHFEHGYEPGSGVDSIVVTNGGTGYASAPNVSFSCTGSCTGTGAAATATVTNGAVTGITMTATGTGYTEEYPPTVTFTPVGGGSGATAIANVAAEIWPITGAQYDDRDYFHEVLGKDFQDPFYGCRSVGDNTLDGTGPTYPQAAQLFPYIYTNQERNVSNPSYAFQWQDVNVYPQQKKVVFPTINYTFWKRVAQQGRGYRGIYYFTFDQGAGSGFKKFGQGITRPMATWVNVKNSLGLGAGVYFFDTTNGADPQGPPQNTAILTPNELWNSSDFGALSAPSFLMEGFIYMNAGQWGTTGMGNNGTTVEANFPGEPFRDIGYPVWCTGVDAPLPMVNGVHQCPAGNAWSDCNGIPCRSGAGDGVWSCEDMNGNGKCDVVVMPAPSWYSNDPTPVLHSSPYSLPACGSGCTSGKTAYVVKTWKSSLEATADYGAPCTLPAATYNGTNPATDCPSCAGGTTNCSEPHEPYWNIIYPDQAADNNGNPYNVVIGWEPPTNQTIRPKKLDTTGNPIPCAACCVWPSAAPGDNEGDCVTNNYDIDGAVVPLTVILQGILYEEGVYNAQGNAWYFGSLLVNGQIPNTNGTGDVWFDEKLLKGSWAPPGMPRVIVFNEQTDTQVQ